MKKYFFSSIAAMCIAAAAISANSKHFINNHTQLNDTVPSVQSQTDGSINGNSGTKNTGNSNLNNNTYSDTTGKGTYTDTTKMKSNNARSMHHSKNYNHAHNMNHNQSKDSSGVMPPR